jgi:hypothetical protein
MLGGLGVESYTFSEGRLRWQSPEEMGRQGLIICATFFRAARIK